MQQLGRRHKCPRVRDNDCVLGTATCFVHRGTRYLCWAQHEPGIENNTNLYLADPDGISFASVSARSSYLRHVNGSLRVEAVRSAAARASATFLQS